MNTNLRWEGTVTATSSIVHGEQSLGTVTYLRRERFLMPDNTTEDIPVISGNAWRGILRRTAADLWWEAAGEPKLTLAVIHAIWSGGALAKNSGTPLTGSRLLRVKELCPPIGLFGVAGGGRIIDGCLQVGKLIPICQETLHILPEHYRTEQGSLPSIWDLTQVENYSKIPTRQKTVEPTTSDTSEEDAYSPVRFGTETFIAGTRFHTWLTATWPTPTETALLQETLTTYNEFARVGGMARSGHGNLTVNLTLTNGNLPTGIPVDWRTPITTATDLLQTLAWLD